MEPRSRLSASEVISRALLVLSLVVAAACVLDTDPPPQPIDITGEITQLRATAEGASILIEETPAQPSGGKKAWVRTDAATEWKGLPQDSPGPLRTGSPAHLAVGMRVDVWFAGAADMSYPMHAKARASACCCRAETRLS